jgi:hypothetical protein
MSSLCGASGGRSQGFASRRGVRMRTLGQSLDLKFDFSKINLNETFGQARPPHPGQKFHCG